MRAEAAGPRGLAGWGGPLTSWLFVPGAAERFMAKLRVGASSSPPPDVIVLDLEDGVAPADLPAARERVAAVLREPSAFVAPTCVRVHAVSHELFAVDLEALGPGLFALVLPKVSSAEEVGEAADALSRLGLGHAGIVPMVESATGLQAAEQVLAAHPSVAAVALGAEDMAGDLGLPPAGLDPEADAARERVMDHVRSRLVVAAAAAGVQRRIDSPTLALRDAERVTRDARRARATGFDAKFAVHPAQVEPIRAGFLPSPAEVAWAREVLAAAGEDAPRGAATGDPTGGARGGAGSAGGRMVDEAVARQARLVLAAAERGGRTEWP